MTSCKGVQFYTHKEAAWSVTKITDNRNTELSFLKCLFTGSRYLLMLLELSCKENCMKTAIYFQYVLRMQFLFSSVYISSVSLSNRSYTIVQSAHKVLLPYCLKLH